MPEDHEEKTFPVAFPAAFRTSAFISPAGYGNAFYELYPAASMVCWLDIPLILYLFEDNQMGIS